MDKQRDSGNYVNKESIADGRSDQKGRQYSKDFSTVTIIMLK